MVGRALVEPNASTEPLLMAVAPEPAPGKAEADTVIKGVACADAEAGIPTKPRTPSAGPQAFHTPLAFFIVPAKYPAAPGACPSVGSQAGPRLRRLLWSRRPGPGWAVARWGLPNRDRPRSYLPRKTARRTFVATQMSMMPSVFTWPIAIWRPTPMPPSGVPGTPGVAPGAGSGST